MSRAGARGGRAGAAGELTSAALREMIARAIASTYPELAVAGLDKVATLRAVLAAHGWPAVVSIGHRLGDLATHPVVRALVAAPEPAGVGASRYSVEPALVIERWRRLEHFGHTRHRTELVAHGGAGDERWLTLRHVARDGGAIAEVDDLFLWGLLIGLLEAAGVRPCRAELMTEATTEATIEATTEASHQAYSLLLERAAPLRALPARTHILHLRLRPGSGDGAPANATATPARDAAVSARLAALIARDLLRTWQLERAAAALQLSPRSLQRALRGEGTTFSRVVLCARLAHAESLLADERLTLTELAFCAGFADQAHFTRAFRRRNDVPPSALRAVLPQRRAAG